MIFMSNKLLKHFNNYLVKVVLGKLLYLKK